MGDEWPFGPPKYASFGDCEAYLRTQGMDAGNARIGAAIATAESSRDLTVVNNTPSTGDYSVGAWQINYYGSLRASRVAAFGRPGQLARGGLPRQSYACYTVWLDSGWGAWSTYNSGAYRQYLGGGGGGPGGGGVPPTVREGDRGATVRELQRDLNTVGFHVTVDGIFGATTAREVRRFQRSRSIAIDGICGPVTWSDLLAAVQQAGTGPGGEKTGPTAPKEPPGRIDPSVREGWGRVAKTYGQHLAGQIHNLEGYTSNVVRSRK